MTLRIEFVQQWSVRSFGLVSDTFRSVCALCVCICVGVLRMFYESNWSAMVGWLFSSSVEFRMLYASWLCVFCVHVFVRVYLILLCRSWEWNSGSDGKHDHLAFFEFPGCWVWACVKVVLLQQPLCGSKVLLWRDPKSCRDGVSLISKPCILNRFERKRLLVAFFFWKEKVAGCSLSWKEKVAGCSRFLLGFLCVQVLFPDRIVSVCTGHLASGR